MSELEIKSTEKFKDIVDYEFVFASGMTLMFMVDKEAGDSIEVSQEHVYLILSKKPSMADPEKIMPEQRITIERRNLATMTETSRQIRIPTAEERAAFKKLMEKALEADHTDGPVIGLRR